MSGGSDFNWSYHDMVLANAKKKFAGWSKEKCLQHFEFLRAEIIAIENEEKKLYQAKFKLNNEWDEILTMLKEFK